MRTYKRIVCRDGEDVSIQAGRHAYCTPRNDDGPYTHVEAGFPSVRPPESWREHIDGDDFDGDGATSTVYGYLPFAAVDEFIAAHGGMVSGELPSRATEAK